MAKAAIYAVTPGDGYGELKTTLRWQGEKGEAGLGAGFNALCAGQAGDATWVMGMDAAAKQLSCYVLLDGGKGLQLKWQLTMPAAYDLIRPLSIGGQPHLIAYESTSGLFDCYRLGDDLQPTRIASYQRTYGAVTSGYTTVEPYDYNGLMLLLAYNIDSGAASIYRLQVPADAPLALAPVWADKWADGWMRFTLFKLGGENFFLKSNARHKTVYIDRLEGDPSQGSHPVGKRLPLPLDLDAVQAFEVDGAICFIAYRATGEATINRLNVDCNGWQAATSFDAVPEAGQAVPLAGGHGKETLLLLY